MPQVCELCCVCSHFSIEVIGETGQELALDGVLSGHERQIVRETVVGGDYNPLPSLWYWGRPARPKIWSTSRIPKSTKELFLSVINLSSL